MTMTKDIFASIVIDMYSASEPPIENIVEHFKTLSKGEKVNGIKHKLHIDKWTEIVNKHCGDMDDVDKAWMMIQLANIGPNIQS